MTEQRRYGDDEIAGIFEAAAAPAARRGATPSNGLTLAELQAVGLEVGIAPERIAEAAASLEPTPGVAARRRVLGVPVSVTRTVDLPRPLTDGEWARLVADLRETFRARGRESSTGETRQWTNGNLHAFVEPADRGYRLRIGSTKGDAGAVTGLGIGGLGMGVIVQVTELLSSGIGAASGAFALGGMGAAALAFNALRLPRWAHERERQMAHIARRVHTIIAPPALAGGQETPAGDLTRTEP